MRELDPKTTSRAAAFEMWSKSPQPMVTLTKTFDVTRIVKASRRRGVKFNMLMLLVHSSCGEPCAGVLHIAAGRQADAV